MHCDRNRTAEVQRIGKRGELPWYLLLKEDIFQTEMRIEEAEWRNGNRERERAVNWRKNSGRAAFILSGSGDTKKGF